MKNKLIITLLVSLSFINLSCTQNTKNFQGESGNHIVIKTKNHPTVSILKEGDTAIISLSEKKLKKSVISASEYDALLNEWNASSNNSQASSNAVWTEHTGSSNTWIHTHSATNEKGWFIPLGEETTQQCSWIQKVYSLVDVYYECGYSSPSSIK